MRKLSSRSAPSRRHTWGIAILILVLLVGGYAAFNAYWARSAPCPTLVQLEGEDVPAPLLLVSAKEVLGGKAIALSCQINDLSVRHATVYPYAQGSCLDPDGTEKAVLAHPFRQNRTLWTLLPGTEADQFCLVLETGHGHLYRTFLAVSSDLPRQVVDVLDAASGAYLYTVTEATNGSLRATTQGPVTPVPPGADA